MVSVAMVCLSRLFFLFSLYLSLSFPCPIFSLPFCLYLLQSVFFSRYILIRVAQTNITYLYSLSQWKGDKKSSRFTYKYSLHYWETSRTELLTHQKYHKIQNLYINSTARQITLRQSQHRSWPAMASFLLNLANLGKGWAGAWDRVGSNRQRSTC